MKSHLRAAIVEYISVNPPIFFSGSSNRDFLFLSVGLIEMASWPAMAHHLRGNIVI